MGSIRNDFSFVNFDANLQILADTFFPAFVPSTTPFAMETGPQTFTAFPSNPDEFSFGVGVIDALDPIFDSEIEITNIQLNLDR